MAFEIYNRWIVLPVFNFLEGFGWVMVNHLVLTILLKTVLLPLTYKSYCQCKDEGFEAKMDEIKGKW